MPHQERYDLLELDRYGLQDADVAATVAEFLLLQIVSRQTLLYRFEQREALHCDVLLQRNRTTHVKDLLQILTQTLLGYQIAREIEAVREKVQIKAIQQLHDVVQKLRVGLITVVQHIDVAQ
uniref:Uncharacterized protein n=1 Tax=Anopheles culicifacies TaxID=139723 RepID=A0A182MVP4_9DIPT